MKFTSLSLCRGLSDSYSDTKVIYSAEAHAFLCRTQPFLRGCSPGLSSLCFHCACLRAMKVCRHRLTSVHNLAWQTDAFSFENIEVFILYGNYHPSTTQSPGLLHSKSEVYLRSLSIQQHNSNPCLAVYSGLPKAHLALAPRRCQSFF